MDLDPDACYRAVQTRDARFDGRFFTGVRTTGIYCRPICPASTPLRSNVDFYITAAGAAEAGLRPCLRCRPETAPDGGAWRGSSNTVNRALILIDQGALDEGGGLESLAERVGVGERHLRRLFHKHLGASPVSIAQTRRVHLAKQLLHETRLTMAEVAVASGFGSVRRFNEAFQQLFGRAPNTLRRQSEQDGSPEPADAVAIKLRYRPPYHWPALLAFLGARAIAGLEWVQADVYARIIEVDGAVGAVLVRPARGEHALAVEVRFPRLASVPAIVAGVRRVFDLGADPQAIDGRLSGDPLLAPLVAARPGLRSPGGWSGFELAARAILERAMTRAGRPDLPARLVAALGTPAPTTGVGDVRLDRAFPRAQAVARADLGGIGVPDADARALRGFAEAVSLDPGLLGMGRDLDQALARLRALPGVDDAMAQNIAMQAMREPDAFPLLDADGLELAFARGAGVGAADLLARAESWRPWRAYAAQHLWAAVHPCTRFDAAASGASAEGMPT